MVAHNSRRLAMFVRGQSISVLDVYITMLIEYITWDLIDQTVEELEPDENLTPHLEGRNEIETK